MSILKASLENPNYKDTAATEHVTIRTLGAGNREYQLEALKEFDNSAYNLLSMPSGSGKSFVQSVLAVKDILNSGFKRKQIILVPQVHIADGFFPENGAPSVFKIKGENKTYSAAVQKEFNFCETASIPELVLWLLADPAKLAQSCTGDNETGGLICMTSYHAFVFAFGRMSHAEQLQACRNLHVRADESHHVAMGDQEEVDDENKTGTILNLLMKQNDNCGLTLSTATNFRSDDKCIVRPEMLNKFKSSNYSFLDHFTNIGIKTLNVDITQSGANPTKDIVEQVCLERDEYHIVVIPPRNAGWRGLISNDPSYGLSSLIAAILKEWPECRILDLVTQSTQAENKQALLAEPEAFDEDHMPQFDVVITCMLGREGTDWCPASRLHVSYVEGSITLAVQTLGRILRRFGHKTEIVARYYFHKFSAPEEGVTKSDLMDDRRNALLFMMQVDDLFRPIALEEVEKIKKSKKDGESKIVTLKDVMGEQAYIEMLADFVDQIEDNITKIDGNLLKQIAEQVVTDHDVPMSFYKKATQILLAKYLRRAHLTFRGVDISFMREHEHDFQELVGTLSADEKTLMFHGYDDERLDKVGSIATSTFQKKCDKLKACGITPEDTWDGIKKKVSGDLYLYNFARYLRRAQNATAVAAGKGK